MYMSKNLYICGYVLPSAEIRHMSKETQVYDKRDLCICPKPYIFVNTCCPLHMSKETYVYVKRDLCMYEQETYMCVCRCCPLPRYDTHVKRDLCIRQKRPMYMSKETYVYVYT